MKNRLVICFVSFVFFVSTATAFSSEVQPIASISGKFFHVIEAAIPEAVRYKINFYNYRIVVFESNSSFVVLFNDPDCPEGQMGSTTKLLGFEVEISKNQFQVIRSNFIR